MTLPPILSCPPVDVPAEYDGLPECTPKPGSTKIECEFCSREVWIGPMQMQHKKDHPKSEVACVICLIEAGIAQVATVRPLSKEGHTYEGIDDA